MTRLTAIPDLRFSVTLFADVQAKAKEQRDLTVDELVNLIAQTEAPEKTMLPLLKLATFGDKRSALGSLRHDENVELVTGAECDYDGEKMPFEEAVSRARAAGVAAIFYTSPSHRPDAPRWRAVFPFAKAMVPDGRRNMVDRANGIFGGVLAGESWALSQSFFYGHVNDDFSLVVTEGASIDTRGDLAAIGNVRSGDLGSLPEKVSKAIQTGDPRLLKRPGASRSEVVFYVACSLVRAGWNDDQIAAVLLDPANGVSEHVRDQNKPSDYAAKQARDARTAVEADWERDAKDKIIADSERNVERALRELGMRVRYDEFSLRTTVEEPGRAPRFLDDAACNHMRFEIKKRHGFRPSERFFEQWVGEMAREGGAFHPVRDYLDGLVWDGVLRLDTWLSRYCEAQDTEYTRAVGRLMLVGAVRRVRQPGSKFDEMLVFVSPQGTGKSTALTVLAVKHEWFTDSVSFDTRGREMIEQLEGKWIVEFAELKGMKDNRIDKIKAQLSRRADRGRPAYGHFQIEAKRQCAFFGTTNSTKPFVDTTGNRRFWPVQVGTVDIEALTRDRDQLWAEAVAAEAVAGDEVRLDPARWPDAEEAQAEHTLEDGWVEHLGEVFGDIDGKIYGDDVWKLLNVSVDRRNQQMVERRGEAMRLLGWEHANLNFEVDDKKKRKANGYVRGEGEERLQQLYVRTDDSGKPFVDVAVKQDIPF